MGREERAFPPGRDRRSRPIQVVLVGDPEVFRQAAETHEHGQDEDVGAQPQPRDRDAAAGREGQGPQPGEVGEAPNELATRGGVAKGREGLQSRKQTGHGVGLREPASPKVTGEGPPQARARAGEAPLLRSRLANPIGILVRVEVTMVPQVIRPVGLDAHEDGIARQEVRETVVPRPILREPRVHSLVEEREKRVLPPADDNERGQHDRDLPAR